MYRSPWSIGPFLDGWARRPAQAVRVSVTHHPGCAGTPPSPPSPRTAAPRIAQLAGGARLAGDRGQALGERVRRERRPGRLGPERALTLTGELLDACGYEPARPEPHRLVLGNCPFQALAGSAPELVCALNREFAVGLLEGLGARQVDAILDPAAAADPRRCCVRLQAPTR
jgi:hypothetical protein